MEIWRLSLRFAVSLRVSVAILFIIHYSLFNIHLLLSEINLNYGTLM